MGGTKAKIQLVKDRLDAVPREEYSKLKSSEEIEALVLKYIPELEDEKWVME